MSAPDLSRAAFSALAAHMCPDCGHRHFYRGPAGGMSVNVACARCGARFNVTVWRGELALAHRIDNTGEWPDRGFF